MDFYKTLEMSPLSLHDSGEPVSEEWDSFYRDDFAVRRDGLSHLKGVQAMMRADVEYPIARFEN
jgi:hypothetical protein